MRYFQMPAVDEDGADYQKTKLIITNYYEDTSGLEATC